MKTLPRPSGVGIAACVLGALLLSGCASTAPKANFAQGMPLGSTIAANDQIKAKVEAEDSVSILDFEKTRIAQRIEERVTAKKIANTGRNGQKSYEVKVTLTRYEKGSAFARAMLAGLGQIHIDAIVRVFDMPAKEEVCEFTIKKTFAWGGIYGASTSMEDIERTFADGIAATLTGQAEDATKKEKT